MTQGRAPDRNAPGSPLHIGNLVTEGQRKVRFATVTMAPAVRSSDSGSDCPPPAAFFESEAGSGTGAGMPAVFHSFDCVCSWFLINSVIWTR